MIRLSLIYGPMRSGKTSILRQAMKQFSDTGSAVALLKPSIDTRRSRQITGIKPVFRVSPDDAPKAAARLVDGAQVIGIDEVQFVAEWTLKFLFALADVTYQKDVEVIAAGLDLKADGTEWPGMGGLIQFATMKTHAVGKCEYCGAPADHTYYEGFLPGDSIAPGSMGYHTCCQSCWSARQ